MTEQELQEICNRIQKGESHNDWFGYSYKTVRGRGYWNVVQINGVKYHVDLKLNIKIIE